MVPKISACLTSAEIESWPSFLLQPHLIQDNFVCVLSLIQKLMHFAIDVSVAITNVYTALALQRKLVLYRSFSCTYPLQSFFEYDFMLTIKNRQRCKDPCRNKADGFPSRKGLSLSNIFSKKISKRKWIWDDHVTPLNCRQNETSFVNRLTT